MLIAIIINEKEIYFFEYSDELLLTLDKSFFCNGHGYIVQKIISFQDLNEWVRFIQELLDIKVDKNIYKFRLDKWKALHPREIDKILQENKLFNFIYKD